MKLIEPELAAMAIAGGIACATPANAADDVVIAHDASGSVWGQIDGTSKIEIVRDVLADLVQDRDAGSNPGLVSTRCGSSMSPVANFSPALSWR